LPCRHELRQELRVNGEVRVVQDVPAGFAGIVRQVRPSSLAVSGGSTARAAYAALAGFADLDWTGVDVLIGDERWVPVGSPDSNEGMARSVLLDGTGARVHSARGAGADIEAAAAAYDQVVAGFPTIDLIHLGVGADGHTASLFPGSPSLDVTDRLVVATAGDHHPHPRLTFTYPAIARGRLVVLTLAGEEKRDVFQRIRAGEELPAARVRAEEVVWLVDPAAAGVAPTG